MCFDLRSWRWSVLPPMTGPRHGLAVAAIGESVYSFEGAAKPSRTASTGIGQALELPPRRTQPATTWRRMEDSPLGRQFTGSTVASGVVWVTGGLATAAVKSYAQPPLP